MPRPELDQRIADRVHHMWDLGLVDEVRRLELAGLRNGRTASRALGYAQVLKFLAGDWTEHEAAEQTIQATRRFVRRQESWKVPPRSASSLDLSSGADLAERAPCRRWVAFGGGRRVVEVGVDLVPHENGTRPTPPSTRSRSVARLECGGRSTTSAAVRYQGHGTGNDFVVLPDPDGQLDLTPELVARLCDRHFGLGADGVLRVVRHGRS